MSLDYFERCEMGTLILLILEKYGNKNYNKLKRDVLKNYDSDKHRHAVANIMDELIEEELISENKNELELTKSGKEKLVYDFVEILSDDQTTALGKLSLEIERSQYFNLYCNYDVGPNDADELRREIYYQDVWDNRTSEEEKEKLFFLDEPKDTHQPAQRTIDIY